MRVSRHDESLNHYIYNVIVYDYLNVYILIITVP